VTDKDLEARIRESANKLGLDLPDILDCDPAMNSVIEDLDLALRNLIAVQDLIVKVEAKHLDSNIEEPERHPYIGDGTSACTLCSYPINAHREGSSSL
jgi:hypothetical protein